MSACVLTIGNFDGVHLGHVALLEEAKRLAHELGVPPRALTFRPHPVAILRPQSAPPLLTTYDEKLALLRARGLEVSEIEFTPALAATSAEDFVERTIFRDYSPKGLVVGHDFKFGRGRQGGLETLSDACLKRGTVLKRATAFKLQFEGHDRVVSSSVIREALAEGAIEDANRMLGREFAYAGQVVAGQGRGKTIGFPTANILPTAGKALLPLGVYATRVTLADGRRVNAVTNVGVRPTMGEDLPLAIETHLIDFALPPGQDLYRQPIAVGFVARLRGEHKFASVDELRAQIARDRQKAVEILR